MWRGMRVVGKRTLLYRRGAEEHLNASSVRPLEKRRATIYKCRQSWWCLADAIDGRFPTTELPEVVRYTPPRAKRAVAHTVSETRETRSVQGNPLQCTLARQVRQTTRALHRL